MKVLIEYKKDAKDTVKVSVKGRDLWSASLTMARVIYPVVKKYRALYDSSKGEHAGFPMDFAADPTKPEGPDNIDRPEEWIKCLDAMVYSFGWIAQHDDWDGPAAQVYDKERERLLKPYKKELEKLELFPSRFAREAEITREAFEVFVKEAEIHHQKVQDGIDLFAKYFGALWT